MIEKIIILSLTTIGICCTFWDDMIFHDLGEKIRMAIGRIIKPTADSGEQYSTGEYLCKPLFGCYICATIWYGVIICLIVGWNPLLAVPAMGASAVFSMLQND